MRPLDIKLFSGFCISIYTTNKLFLTTMDGKWILAVLALVIFIAFVCTIVTEADQKDKKDSENLKTERNHKRLAGKED